METRINVLLELFEQKELSKEFDQKFCHTLTEIFNVEQASIIEYNATFEMKKCFFLTGVF